MNIAKFETPTGTVWPSFVRVASLSDELDRLFGAPGLAGSLGCEFRSSAGLALDAYEDKDSLVIKVELPGVKKDEIEVALHDGTLTISGERKPEALPADAEVYRAERAHGKFQRSLVLPTPVAADRVKANYVDGVLVITLPKSEEAKPKKIDVAFN